MKRYFYEVSYGTYWIFDRSLGHTKPIAVAYSVDDAETIVRLLNSAVRNDD